jgi:hypothetical protein
MQKGVMVAFCILGIIISCVSCASGYDPYPGNPGMSAEWKWNYAQSYSEKELAATGVQITDYDIEYAKGKVATAEHDCSNMGGVWCTYANDDRNALQRMLNVQARQSNNPSPVVVDSGPIPDLTNIISSARDQLVFVWSQLRYTVRNIFGF